MWVNVDPDHESIRGMTTAFRARLSCYPPLSIQMQVLKRVGDDAKLYHIGGQTTAIVTFFQRVDIVLKHSFQALGSVCAEYENNLTSEGLLLICEEETTEQTFKWMRGGSGRPF
tara:strand:- start:2348 stop:2689 length:342 start_codon:yes stop_codon:yes gene_type:complete